MEARLVPILLGGFDPRRLPGLAAWFRYGLGITGTAVSQWDDASGKAHHLKQATAGSRPALQSDGSILLDGTDDYLACDAFTLNQPTTVYFLGKQVTWGNKYIWDGNGVNSGALLQVTATPQLRAFAGVASDRSDLAVDTYGVVCVVYNSTASVFQINATAATVDLGTGNMGGFTLGAAANFSAPSNIQVKEIAIYSTAHDAGARTRMVNYLARKGGVTL